jgi:hypothetical protein
MPRQPLQPAESHLGHCLAQLAFAAEDLVLVLLRALRRWALLALQQRIEDEMMAYRKNGTMMSPATEQKAINKAMLKGTPEELVLSWLLLDKARIALVVMIGGMVNPIGPVAGMR